MKRFTLSVTLTALVIFSVFTVNAQPAHHGRPGSPPPPFGGPLKAMDTNGDGIVSESEWTAFHLKMFKNFDKDNNGYVTDEELCPPFEEEEEDDYTEF